MPGGSCCWGEPPGTVLVEGNVGDMSQVEVRLTGGPLADYTAEVDADGLRRDEHGRLTGGLTVAYQLQWWNTEAATPVWAVRYVIEPDTTPLRAHYGGYVVAPSTT